MTFFVCGARRQRAGRTSAASGESVGAMTSIVDRRPSWPLAPRSDRKHVSSPTASSSARQRPWTAMRQPGISMAPKLAPANGSAASCEGTAPAEARPPEGHLRTQPQQSDHQPARLPSPAPVFADHHNDQASAESNPADHSNGQMSAQERPAVETISRQKPNSVRGLSADQGSIDPKSTQRTSLAQHIAAHGPPRLIFFDLETTGAALSRCASFICQQLSKAERSSNHCAMYRSRHRQGKDCRGGCYGPRYGRTVFDPGEPQRC